MSLLDVLRGGRPKAQDSVTYVIVMKDARAPRVPLFVTRVVRGNRAGEWAIGELSRDKAKAGQFDGRTAQAVVRSSTNARQVLKAFPIRKSGGGSFGAESSTALAVASPEKSTAAGIIGGAVLGAFFFGPVGAAIGGVLGHVANKMLHKSGVSG